MAGNVRVRDLGWRKIKTDVKALDGRGVKVGLRAGAASGDVIMYAAAQELGTDTIPARPFLRRTVDTSEREVGAFARSLAAGIVAGRLGAEQALDRLGLWFQSRIQQSITSARSWATPLAPPTVARKGSSAPLIDTGTMRASISYEKTRR